MDISGVLTAASKGDVASVQDFLEQDGSMANYYGWLVAGKDLMTTPLHMAAYNESPMLTNLLLAYGAETETLDSCGQTPLIIAAYTGNVRVAIALLGGGADANAQNKSSFSPLHYACKRGYTELAANLIHVGADVNLPTGTGETPLMTATASNSVPIVKLLLEHEEVDLDLIDEKGKSVYEYVISVEVRHMLDGRRQSFCAIPILK